MATGYRRRHARTCGIENPMMLARLLQSMRRVLLRRSAAAAPMSALPALGLQTPGSVEAAQAITHFEAGRYAEARPFFESLHRHNPDDADTLYRLGVIYGSTGLLHEAKQMLDRCEHLRPGSVDVFNAQANVAWLQSDWVRAEQHFLAALDLDPENATLLANFGLCLHDAGRLDAAAAALARALACDPAHPDALVNATLVAMDQNDTPRAQALLERALHAQPAFPEAHALQAQLLLRQGRYADGWREYEWRLRCRDGRYLPTELPRWQGAAANSLQIYAEQGLGDQIMFASCLPDVIGRVTRCDAECDPRLLTLFSRSFPAIRFHAQRPDLARPWATADALTACQIHAGSLPQLLRGSADQFSGAAYLRPDPLRVAYWQGQLATLGTGLKVGIAWRGGVPRTRQAMRSIAPSELQALLLTQGARFVSLQHAVNADEWQARPPALAAVAHWPQALRDGDEMAALISALDLVITVCGTVVHLAGALGKTAWVLVPACPEWRYLDGGDRMPWYSSVQMFRQSVTNDWREPLAAVSARLAAATAAA